LRAVWPDGRVATVVHHHSTRSTTPSTQSSSVR
jgi:hypothetical protein